MNNSENFNDLIENIRKKKQGKLNLKDNLEELEQKKEIIKQELPAMDEELLFWKKEIESIKNKHGMEEELLTWENEIKEIKNNKEDKLRELEQVKLKLIENTQEIKKIDDYLSESTNSLRKEIIDKLNKKTDSKELFFLLKSLKETIKELENSNITLIKFLEILKSENIEINGKILNICSEIFEEKNIFAIPNSISDFIADYIKDSETKKVLDPCPAKGMITLNLIKNLKNFNFYSWDTNKIEKSLFLLLEGNENKLNYIPKNSSNDEFDYIIEYIDSDLDEISVELEHLNDKIELVDSNSYIKLLKHCLKLGTDGKGIFLIDNDFILKRDKRSVFSNLEKFDLSIGVIIDIPGNYLLKNSNKSLIIIENTKKSELFVGALNLDNKSNEILLANLNKKKDGKIPQYGAITNINSFYSFKTFLAQEDSLNMASDLNLSQLFFSEIAKEINVLDKTEYLDNPNSIYLPLLETEDVIFSLEKAKNNENNYIQIVLNEEKALSEYIANYFNTDLGRKLRESFNLDQYTSRFIEKKLKEIKIPIPDLNTQIEILRINSLIEEIYTRATTYKHELWKRPDESAMIRENIESLDEESEYRFERWVESLPFPLASILWESMTNSKFEYKVKYLLHFFEAFSEFNVTFMISGIISDDRFFKKEISRCFSNDRKWFLSPSFGNWNHFGKCIAQNIRRLLKNQQKSYKLQELFGNLGNEFLEKVCSEEIYEILDEVLKYRNIWEGHGPIVNANEYENRYKILRSIVSKLYRIISNAYEDNLFILPAESSYKDGIYHYTVKTFMGSRTPFKSIYVETVIPMDSNKIYFINKNQKNPVEVLNLLKFQNESCYYYNSRFKETYQAQYVSYHNKNEPEIFYPFNEIDSFVSLFERRIFNFY